MKTRPAVSRLYSATLTAIAMGQLPVSAASIYWDGSSASWNTASNWSTVAAATTPDPAAVPGASDTAIFNIVTGYGPVNVTLDANQSASGLIFNNTGTTNLRGNSSGTTARTLTIGTGNISLNGGAVTIGDTPGTYGAVNLSLSGVQTWTNNSPNLFSVTGTVTNGANNLTIGGFGNTSISGVIGSGAGTLTKSGTGTLTLTGANTYTGITTISGGVVNAGVAQTGTTSGPLGTNGNIVFGGGILQFSSASAAWDPSARIATGTSTIAISIDTAGQSVTFGTGLTSLQSGGLTKLGSGTLKLTATNAYTGTTTISGGTLSVNRQTGSLPTVALTFGANGTLNVDNVGAGAGVSQALAALTFSAGEGTVQLTRTASQPVTLSFTSMAARSAGAARNFVYGGTPGTIGTDSTITLTGATAGFMDQASFVGGTSYAFMNGAGTYPRAYASGDANYVSVAGGTTTMGTRATADNVALGGNISAQTTANGSVNTINLGANSITMSSSTDVLQTAGLLSNGSSAATIGSTGGRLQAATSGGELSVRVNGGTDQLTIGSIIQNNSSASALNKSGAGTLVLTATNTFSGTSYLNAGTLTLQNQNALQSSSLTMAGGALVFDSSVAANAFTLNSLSSTLSGTGFDIALQNNAGSPAAVALTLNVTANKTYNGVLSGPGSLIKLGTSQQTLGAMNTYSGGTTVSAGTLALTASGAVGTGAVTVNSNGTIIANGGGLIFNNGLTLNGGTMNISFNGATPVWAGPVNLTANSTISASSSGGSGRISGNISSTGAFGFTKTGADRLFIAGASNTYTGPTVVNSNVGPVTFQYSIYGNDTAKWIPSNVTVNSGSTLALNVGGAGEFTPGQFATFFNNLTTSVNNNGMLAGSFMGINTENATSTVTISGTLTDSTGTGGGAVGLNFVNSANNTSTVELTGPNTFSGPVTTDRGNTLKVSSLNSVATNATLGTVHSSSSNLGAPTTVANGTISLGNAVTFGGGTLLYNGSGEITDRVIKCGGGGSAGTTSTIDQSGSGLLKFVSDVAHGDTRLKAFQLQGSTAGTGEFAGAIINPSGGNMTLTKAGTGKWTLSGANTYLGSTTINSSGGILQFAKLVSLYNNTQTSWTTTNLIVNTGSTLALNVGGTGEWNTTDLATFLDGTHMGASTTTTGFKTGSFLGLDTSNAGGSFTPSAAIPLFGTGNSVGLKKLGTGSLILNLAQAYTGSTTVSAGTLLVNSPGSLTSGSAVTVASGATLGGTGTVGGAVTVSAGGALQIGATSKTLTLSSSTAPTYNQTGGTTYTTLKLLASSPTLDKVSTSASTGNSVANVDLVIDTTGLSGNVSGVVIYSAGGAIAGPFHNVAMTGNTNYVPTIDYSTAGQIKLSLVAPLISASNALPAALSSIYGTASGSQSISVSGSGLTAGITATAQSGFEVSSDNVTFGPAASYPQSGGSAGGSLYVRFTASKGAGIYDSVTAATLTSTGAAPANVATSFSGNTVSQRALTFTGGKAYDGLASATAAQLSFSNNIDGGNLTKSGNVTLATAAPGTAGISSFSGLALGGAAAGNYTLTGAGGSVSITGGSMESWLAANYPGLTGADVLPTANPDGDGLTNLQEFAFGTDPTASSGGSIAWVAGGAVTNPGLPVAINLAVGSGVDYRAVFGRRKDYLSAGLTYTVQFSADLNYWWDSSATPAVLTGAGDLNPSEIEAASVTYPFFIPLDPPSAGVVKPTYFRVKVSN